MPRRGKGEGSVFQRKDGRWAGFVTLGYGPDGKQRKRWVYGRTRREVAEKLTRLLPKAGAGYVADPGGLRLGDYLYTWVEQRAAMQNLRPTTVRNYRVYLKHVGTLAGIPLGRVHALHLRGLFADLAHLSPSVRRHIYQFLRAALRDAVRASLLDANPMDAVDPPRGGQVRPARAWRPDEVARFLEAAQGHRLYPLFALMLATGLRPGEALALRWEDWEGETLHVRHTLLRDGTLGPTKTPGSNGILYLDPATQNLLQEWRERLRREKEASPAWVEHALIFPSTRGTPLEYGNVKRAFYALQEKAGVSRITPHGLRHTYTSLALRAGLPPKVVAARLRHADPTFTVKVYQQLMDEDHRAAALDLDTLLHLNNPQNTASAKKTTNAERPSKRKKS
jgi:integrase